MDASADNRRRDLARWLFTALFTLAVGGLYALPLAAGRNLRGMSEEAVQRLFNIVLAVHVDLSIFLWFLAMVALCWRLALPTPPERRLIALPFFQTAGWALFTLGSLLMAVSPFFGPVEGLRSNYIPMLTNHAFMLSLALVASGLFLCLSELLFGLRPLHTIKAAFSREFDLSALLRYAAYGAAFITAVSLAAFEQSSASVDPALRGESYYDIVFWAGGHVIQFAYTQAAMLAWLAIAQAAGVRLPGGNRVYGVLLSLGPLAMLYVPVPFLRYPVESAEFRDGFTLMMILANGLAPALLALPVAWAAWRQRRGLAGHGVLLAVLFSSILLFLYGGVLGVLIEGQNVVIPAHYHGSIVGITLAFMGLAYVLLPQLGYADVARWRLAFWQPVILCAGQAIHVSALAWSGGYGVLRKTVGVDGFPFEVRVAMGLLGAGSGLASLGGLLFVIAVIRSVRKGRKTCLANSSR